MEQAYGLSFANNDFVIPKPAFDTFNKITALQEQKWNAVKNAYTKTSDDLANSVVNEVDRPNLDNAINTFNTTMKPITESHRFEDGDIAIENAARTIANDKVLNRSIAMQAEYMKGNQAIMDDKKLNYTDQQKKLFLQARANTWKQHSIDPETGAITGGYSDLQMNENPDVSLLIKEAMEGFREDKIYTSVNTKARGEYDSQIISMAESAQGLDQEKVKNYLSWYLATNNKVKGYMETKAIINSVIPTTQLLSERVNNLDTPYANNTEAALTSGYADARAIDSYKKAASNGDAIAQKGFAKKYPNYDAYFVSNYILPKDITLDQFKILTDKENAGLLKKGSDEYNLMQSIKNNISRVNAQLEVNETLAANVLKYNGVILDKETLFSFNDQGIYDRAKAKNERITIIPEYETFENDIQQMSTYEDYKKFTEDKDRYKHDADIAMQSINKVLGLYNTDGQPPLIIWDPRGGYTFAKDNNGNPIVNMKGSDKKLLDDAVANYQFNNTKHEYNNKLYNRAHNFATVNSEDLLEVNDPKYNGTLATMLNIRLKEKGITNRTDADIEKELNQLTKDNPKITRASIYEKYGISNSEFSQNYIDNFNKYVNTHRAPTYSNQMFDFKNMISKDPNVDAAINIMKATLTDIINNNGSNIDITIMNGSQIEDNRVAKFGWDPKIKKYEVVAIEMDGSKLVPIVKVFDKSGNPITVKGQHIHARVGNHTAINNNLNNLLDYITDDEINTGVDAGTVQKMKDIQSILDFNTYINGDVIENIQNSNQAPLFSKPLTGNSEYLGELKKENQTKPDGTIDYSTDAYTYIPVNDPTNPKTYMSLFDFTKGITNIQSTPNTSKQSTKK